MPAYINGSLALDERRSKAAAPAVHTNAKPAVKKGRKASALTAPEKLLYLFGVVAFSLILGVVIWRHAVIFEMNTHIVQMESEIRKLEKENTALKNEVAKLQDPQRLIDSGIQLGLVLPDEIAPPKDGDQAVAMTEN